MSEATLQEQPDKQTHQPATQALLPDDVKVCVNGQLDGETVVAWAEYDLDEQNRYHRAFAILTEGKLILLDGAGGAEAKTVAIPRIEEAKISEQLGLDRLTVLVDGQIAAELRYSRRNRRGMARLQRKLQRRLPRKEGDAEPPPPDWLEVVEREAEAKELCPRCNRVIPSYAEGVCPQCLQKRRVLWRLLDVARPYRRRISIALVLTLFVAPWRRCRHISRASSSTMH